MTKIPWHQLISKQLTIGVVGMKRQGKTYWMSRVAMPELVKRGIPFIFFDCVGGMVEHAVELKTAFVIEVDAWIMPGMPGFLHLQNILVKSWKKKQGILLDLGGLLQDQKADFINSVSRWIWKNEKIFRRGVVGVDEVHEVVPQDRGRYSPEFERLLRQGGNHELAFIISTQRPATVNKNLWYLTDILVVFRQTYEPDVRPILDVIKHAQTKEDTDAALSKIANLQVGQCVIIKWALPTTKSRRTKDDS